MLSKCVVFPVMFTGDPQYMHERQSDVIVYVRKFGCPNLFITMTCNPKWEEITSTLIFGEEVKDL